MSENGSPCVQIEAHTLSKTAGTGGALEIQIEYPSVSGCACAPVLSAFYKKRAEDRLRACLRKPLGQAERQTRAFGGLTQPLRAGSSFCVMYNRGGLLSIFCDSWEELGCAGSFLRRESCTWELGSGRAVPASAFFRRSAWRKLAADSIVQQIAQWESRQEGAFFSDARSVCRRLYGYYLADDGMVFYYPAETLGPRNLGIPSFLVRYESFGNMLSRPL